VKRQKDNAAIAREIITRLQVAPGSVEELADEMKLDPLLIRTAVRGLLSAGEVTMFQGRSVEGGPFYCLPGYVERPSPVERGDFYVGRDYISLYENPAPDL
jgi:hypothetical protein